MNQFRFQILVAFAALVVIPQLLVAGTDDDSISIGHVETFQSKVLGEKRTLEIRLPEGFEDSDQSYPLVVVLDGGSMFRYTVACVEVLTPNFFPEMVIVGLPNTDRGRDLDPTENEGKTTAKFMSFLESELVPYFQETYRAKGFRVLMGHSLAGLYTFHTMVSRPSLFDAAIATSPSITFPGSSEVINGDLERLDSSALSGRYLYLSAGGDEPEVLHQRVEDFKNRLSVLEADAFACEADVFEGEGHFPMKGFYQGLRRAFREWGPPTEWFFSGTLDELREHYRRAGERYKIDAIPPSDMMWSLRRRYERQGMADEYLAVTEYHVELYPDNVARYLVLADAYAERERLNDATATLERGLRIDPNADDLRKRLDELREQQKNEE